MKRFTKHNNSFICLNCGTHNPQHATSSRDHCIQCLYSMHVDINPGDRMNPCKGLLEPIGIQQKNGKVQIVYRCQQCKQIVFNIVAEDDNKDVLLELSHMPW